MRPTELNKLKRLEKLHSIRILPHDVPGAEALQKKKVSALLEGIAEITKKAKLTQYLEYVHELASDDISVEEVAAAAIKMLFEKDAKAYDTRTQFISAQDELKKVKSDNQRPGNYPPRSGKKFYKNKRRKG